MLKVKYYKSGVVWVLYQEDLFQIPITAAPLAALCPGALEGKSPVCPESRTRVANLSCYALKKELLSITGHRSTPCSLVK